MKRSIAYNYTETIDVEFLTVQVQDSELTTTLDCNEEMSLSFEQSLASVEISNVKKSFEAKDNQIKARVVHSMYEIQSMSCHVMS